MRGETGKDKEDKNRRRKKKEKERSLKRRKNGYRSILLLTSSIHNIQHTSLVINFDSLSVSILDGRIILKKKKKKKKKKTKKKKREGKLGGKGGIGGDQIL